MHPIDLSQYKKIHHIGDIMLERIQRIATREPKGDVTLVKGLKQHNSQSLQIQRLTYTGE